MTMQKMNIINSMEKNELKTDATSTFATKKQMVANTKQHHT